MIGKRLRAARKKAGLTQAELAKAAGIDQTVSRISHYETGSHTPNFQQACKFADVLGVPECYLYCRDDLLAEYLISVYNQQKNYHLNPTEVTDLHVAYSQLVELTQTIATMLDRRIETNIIESLKNK